MIIFFNNTIFFIGKMKSLGKGNLMRGGPQQLAKMANMVPPQIMKQMGG